MLALLLNHSPAFLTGELLLGLSLGLFGVAFGPTASRAETGYCDPTFLSTKMRELGGRSDLVLFRLPS